MAPNSMQRGGTYMDKKRLDYYKKKLLARREELMRTIARTQEEGRTADEDPTVDLADKAANSYTKEFLFGMTNTDRSLLNLIDAALKRIQKPCPGPSIASRARRKWSRACYKRPRPTFRSGLKTVFLLYRNFSL